MEMFSGAHGGLLMRCCRCIGDLFGIGAHGGIRGCMGVTCDVVMQYVRDRLSNVTQILCQAT